MTRGPAIVLVTGTLGSGGAERVLSEMANYWAARGWRVTLATFSTPEMPDFYTLSPAVTRHWLGGDAVSKPWLSRIFGNWRRVRALRRLLRASGASVVLSFIDIPNILTIIASRGLNMRVVISERCNPDQLQPGSRYLDTYRLSAPWLILRRATYRRAQAVTALNGAAAAWLARECGIAVEVIPNPLRPLPPAVAEREMVILGVGRLAREKGFDLLLRAFAKIHRDFATWRVVICGTGPECDALISLGGELGIADRVEFLGEVRNVETWMGRAGLVVLPSRLEAYGNAVLESLGMGAAVISTACAGPSSLITDGVNGRLVPIDNLDSLAAAMAELLADPQRRQSLGKEASRVKESHSQELIMGQWTECVIPTYTKEHTK